MLVSTGKVTPESLGAARAALASSAGRGEGQLGAEQEAALQQVRRLPHALRMGRLDRRPISRPASGRATACTERVPPPSPSCTLLAQDLLDACDRDLRLLADDSDRGGQGGLSSRARLAALYRAEKRRVLERCRARVAKRLAKAEGQEAPS